MVDIGRVDIVGIESSLVGILPHPLVRFHSMFVTSDQL